MPVDELLNEDWAEYDNKKIIANSDARFFSCTEIWERNYLNRKIKLKFPHLDEFEIESAINKCCFQLSSPISRRIFVSCVYRRLGII